VELSDRGLVEILSLHLPGRAEENHEISQSGSVVPADIRTEHPPNTGVSVTATSTTSLL
jgi:hypothetical protein